MTVSETHLVMHGLAIKKHATPEAVAGIVGLDVEDVRAALGKLVEAKRVVEARGKYLLAPAARMALDADYSRLYEDAARQSRFCRRIRGVRTTQPLAEATDHRMADDRRTRPGGPQRSQRQGYDEKIIDRLGDLHERAEAALDDLRSACHAFRSTATSLARRSKRPRTAKIEWVSDAKIESYHTLWFELHEDLLRLMRRERARIDPDRR